MKSLQIKSIDLEKFTKFITDRQPSSQEMQKILESYVENLNLTHIAISVPLDSNEAFLKHSHIPSPLTVDSFTKMCIESIHSLGIGVYFKGTFCGIQDIYNFGFDLTSPIGTIEDHRENSWIGRTEQWLDTHLESFQNNDIFGLVPDPTLHIKDSHFFLNSTIDYPVGNLQNDLLLFYSELARLYSSKDIKQGNYSSQLYQDVIDGFIPSFIYDLTGIITITCLNKEESPQELEKNFNELYSQYHQPIFINGWSLPKESLTTTNIDLKVEEYFNMFGRLRDKGILVGMNYFDGISFDEGVINDNKLNKEGEYVKKIFSQDIQEQTITKKIKIDTKVTKQIIPQKEKKKRGRKSRKPSLSMEINNEAKPIMPIKKSKKVSINYLLLLQIALYMIGGMILTILTVSVMGIHINVLILIMEVIYALLITILYFLIKM